MWAVGMIGGVVLGFMVTLATVVLTRARKAALPVPSPPQDPIMASPIPSRVLTRGDIDETLRRYGSNLSNPGAARMVLMEMCETHKQRFKEKVMRKLNGHQVNPVNDLIEIEVMDEPGEGGACHDYRASAPCPNHPGGNTQTLGVFRFQNGPIAEAGVNGITHEVLLAILIDRMEHFQSGFFACRENAIALTHMQDAQHWLLHRTKKRMDRGVEGTNEL